MNHDMSMSYRKIRRQSLQFNSLKNIYLRQQWAIRFLESDIQGKTVINVDESWIGTSDFRRMNWAYRAKNNNLAVKNLSPRISMLVALDTRGEVFLSLS